MRSPSNFVRSPCIENVDIVAEKASRIALPLGLGDVGLNLPVAIYGTRASDLITSSVIGDSLQETNGLERKVEILEWRSCVVASASAEFNPAHRLGSLVYSFLKVRSILLGDYCGDVFRPPIFFRSDSF